MLIWQKDNDGWCPSRREGQKAGKWSQSQLQVETTYSGSVPIFVPVEFNKGNTEAKKGKTDRWCHPLDWIYVGGGWLKTD